MPVIASTPAIVSDGIHRFQQEVARSTALAGRLGYMRAWYAEQDEGGRWRFGPSKFVGYEGLDAETYLDPSDGKDGRRTEAQLQEWFTEVDPSSELYGELSPQLAAFLALYDKAPSTMMRINVLTSVYDQHHDTKSDGDDSLLIDLIVAVASRLPSSELKVLRERLKVVSR